MVVVVVGFPVWRWRIQRPSPTASWEHFKWVAPKGEMLANVLQQRLRAPIEIVLRRMDIRSLRVPRAMAENASIRAMSGADSPDSRNGIRHLEKPRAGPRTGDLAQVGDSTLPTSWPRPRVGTQMPLDHEKYLQEDHFPAWTR